MEKWVGILLLSLSAVGFADPPYEIAPAESPIAIDGALTEPAWSHALALELQFETDPGENIPAPMRTTCYLTYDEKYLYAGFVAEDPEPESVRAHYSDRDNIPRDDFLGLVLDTFHDHRRAVEFFANPFGVQYDLTFDDVGGSEDSSWDAIWYSAGRLTEKGYEVEIAIPFTSLRFARSESGQTWGIDIVRYHPRSKRRRFALNPQDRNRNCSLCQNAELIGFQGILSGRNIEVVPTLTGNRTDSLEEGQSSLTHGSLEADAGLSSRWGITPNLNLNGTVNPDFSQVEADVAQLDVNTRFALFFPEKRPFFLEGADIFDSLFTVIYTRTIADPDWGVKLTGKTGPHALGALISRDAINNLLIPSNQGSQFLTLAQSTSTTVGRYRNDVWSGSTLGVLAVNREGDGYFNRLVATDAFLRITGTDILRFQLLRSETRYPDSVALNTGQPADAFSGLAGSLRYRHDDRNWAWHFNYDDYGEDFRADAGFIPRVDVRSSEASFERILRRDNSWFSSMNIGFFASRKTRHNGLLTDDAYAPFYEMSGPLQSYLNLSAAKEREYFNGTLYDVSDVTWFFNIRPTGQFTCSVGGTIGNTIDYQNSRPANIMRIEPGFTYNIGRHWYIQGDHALQHFTTDDAKDIFTANLTQLRLVYQFNNRTFVRAILQYTDIRNNPATNGDGMDPHQRRLFGQYLFSYKLNPQTVLFIGYSDTDRGDSIRDFQQVSRTFFVKIGYAWVM